MKSSQYDIKDHRHRFSAWAAARAAQRGLKGGTVSVFTAALESCGIVEFVRTAKREDVDEGGFRSLHEKWCNAIVAYLHNKVTPKPSFGHATKLVAMYLKSMVIMGPDGNTELARLVYPPIDSNLLKNISKAPDIAIKYKADWKKVKWTRLDRQGYYKLIDQLRDCFKLREFWKLEQFWDVTGSKDDL